MQEDAIWTNASDSAYVAGSVEKIGRRAFNFPVGDKNRFMPIHISAPNLAGDAFKARYYRLHPDSAKPAPYHINMLAPDLHHVGSCEFWILDRTSGNSSAYVTLGWRENGCGITNIDDIVVARWDGNLWQNEGQGTITGNLDAGTISTAASVSSFSPFILASTTKENPMPVTLLDFRARAKSKVVEIEWETTSEINNDYFTIEKSRDGKNWEKYKDVPGAGNSNSLKEYSEIDYSPFNGVSYYRLKQTDFNGEYEYSKVVPVVLSVQQTHVYPNPIKDWLFVDNINASNTELRVYSIEGKLIYSGNQSKINTSEWAEGIYELLIIDGKEKNIERIKLVKIK